MIARAFWIVCRLVWPDHAIKQLGLQHDIAGLVPEEYLRRRQCARLRVRPRVAQQEIAEPALSYRSYLLLDRLHRRARLLRSAQIEQQREARRERANRPPQVHVGEQTCPPVVLQLDQHCRAADPARERLGQRGEHQFARLGAIGRRQLV